MQQYDRAIHDSASSLLIDVSSARFVLRGPGFGRPSQLVFPFSESSCFPTSTRLLFFYRDLRIPTTWQHLRFRLLSGSTSWYVVHDATVFFFISVPLPPAPALRVAPCITNAALCLRVRVGRNDTNTPSKSVSRFLGRPSTPLTTRTTIINWTPPTLVSTPHRTLDPSKRKPMEDNSDSSQDDSMSASVVFVLGAYQIYPHRRAWSSLFTTKHY